MTRIDIIGGVYKEECSFPIWSQIYGSAGRAAAALSGHVDEITLHTLLSGEEVDNATLNLESYDLNVISSKRKNSIGFSYLHTLETPKISPSLRAIEMETPIEVNCDIAVQFGMVECVPKVVSNICIYDPQSPINPIPFSKTNSKTKSLVVVANLSEARLMINDTNAKHDVAADILMKSENAEIVLIKCGLNGVFVKTRTQSRMIAAYKSKSSFTIGSGDVFVAAFGLAWAVLNKDPFTSAEFASKSTAKYVQSRTLPIDKFEKISSSSWEPAKLKTGSVYLAGPFREVGQRYLIDNARENLIALGLKVFSPVHDIGHGSAEEVVTQDIAAIRKCDAMFAFLNGSSPGTVFEIGYARAIGKPVFAVTQNMREVDVKLPKGTGSYLYDDYVSCLFNLAWRD